MDLSRGIGWNTTEGEVMASGEARFEEVAPGRTRVAVTMNDTNPPGGRVGEAVSDVRSGPERNLQEDLQNFIRSRAGRARRAAEPDAEPEAPRRAEEIPRARRAIIG